MNQPHERESPSLLKWGLGVAASAGLTGMICCVAPMVLFMFGIMGGTYAISFANFFYNEDGTTGIGAWVLRCVAVVIGAYGVWRYRSVQTQCSIDPKRQQQNVVLLSILVMVTGLGFFLSFEALSSWYFDTFIVPAQQRELGLQ